MTAGAAIGADLTVALSFAMLAASGESIERLASDASEALSDELGGNVAIYRADETGFARIDDPKEPDGLPTRLDPHSSELVRAACKERGLLSSRRHETGPGLVLQRGQFALARSLRIADDAVGMLLVIGPAVTVVNAPGSRLLDRLVALLAHSIETDNLRRDRDRYMAFIAHEMRTPLAAIDAALGIVTELPDGDDAARWLELAGNNARRLMGMINTMLEVDRIATVNPSQMEVIPVRRLLEASIDAVRALAEVRDVAIVLTCDDAAVTGERTLLEQVFVNLLSNACKHAPDGSRVTIETRRAGGMIEFTVCDEGPGVPPELVETLFMAYESDSSRQVSDAPSTGLGLALVRSVVLAHGGNVRYDPARRPGATFVVNLPLTS